MTKDDDFRISHLLGKPPARLLHVTCGNTIGGIVFLLFGAMNFYTHIGMYHNIAYGTDYKW